MARVPLTREQHKRLVRLVAERAGVLTPLERENLLERAGLEQVKTKLNFNTDAGTFSQQLIRVLQERVGTLAETGQPALVSLLRELSEIVAGDEDEAAFVASLLAPYGPQGAGPAAPPRSPAGPIRLLFLGANPLNTTRLRLDVEVRTIREQLREADLRDRFHLEQEWAVREQDLSRVLLAHRPHLVHFAGHGEQGGKPVFEDDRDDERPNREESLRHLRPAELIFEDDRGIERPLPGDVLSELFRILRGDIRCVVLNACWSERQARALVDDAGIPCVAGMTTPVSDAAAIAFAAGFYQALGYGESVQTAFDLARNAVWRVSPRERDVPALLVAPGIEAWALFLK